MNTYTDCTNKPFELQHGARDLLTTNAPFVFIRGGEGTGKTTNLTIFALTQAAKGLNGLYLAAAGGLMIHSWRTFTKWVDWGTTKVLDYTGPVNDPPELLKPYTLLFENGAMLTFAAWGDTTVLNNKYDYLLIDEARHTESDSNPYFEKCMLAAKQIAVATTPPYVDFRKPDSEHHWVWQRFCMEPAALDPNVVDPYGDFKKQVREYLLTPLYKRGR